MVSDADVSAGQRSAMLAWRRKVVDALNRHALRAAITADAARRTENSLLPRREQAAARREVEQLRERLRSAVVAWERHGAPHEQALTETIGELNDVLHTLPTSMDRFQQQELLRHRVTHLQHQLGPDHALDRGRALGR